MMVSLGQCLHDVTLSHGLFISLFLAGLMGGFAHCAGMCSPFVLAQIDAQKSLVKMPSTLLLPYHFGRITSYVFMAVLVSGVINLAFVYSDMKALISAPILMLAASIFLISAFPKLGALFPWVARIRISLPYRFVGKVSGVLLNNSTIIKRYVLGVLLGFMPCGLVVSALLAASTAPNMMASGLAMGAFGVGTMPALILVAMGGGFLKQKYPRASQRFSQGAMALSSLWLFALAGQIIFQ